MREATVQVTAWNNGGATYGLEVHVSDRDRYFDRGWRNVVLELAGQGNAVGGTCVTLILARLL
jgi:hypothetical protein